MTAATGIDVCDGLRRDPRRDSGGEGAIEETMDCRSDRVEPSRLDPARESARTAGETGAFVRSVMDPMLLDAYCAELGRECAGVAFGEEDSRTRLRC